MRVNSGSSVQGSVVQKKVTTAKILLCKLKTNTNYTTTSEGLKSNVGKISKEKKIYL